MISVMRSSLVVLLFAAACGKVQEGPPADSSHLPGQCGSASGVMVSSAPTRDLCTLGDASSVTGAGPWSWTCTGPGGATNCSASVAGPEGERLPAAGNPDGGCTSLQLPASAQPVDTSAPDQIVGTGTPESCTFAELKTAGLGFGLIVATLGVIWLLFAIPYLLRLIIALGVSWGVGHLRTELLKQYKRERERNRW